MEVDLKLQKKLKLLVFSNLATARSRTPRSVENEIKEMEGNMISLDEYRKAGFRDLIDLLDKHEEIQRLPNGEYTTRSNNGDVQDITNLVNAQKKKKGKAKRPYSAMPMLRNTFHMKSPKNRPTSTMMNRQTVRFPVAQQIGLSYVPKPFVRPKTTVPMAISPAVTPSPFQPQKNVFTNHVSVKSVRKTSPSPFPDLKEKRESTIYAPAQKSGAITTIKEFRDNVIKMFKNHNGLKIHVDQLSAEYQTIYGVYIDPYKQFAKKWPTLITTIFSKDLMMDKNNIVQLVDQRPASAMPNLPASSNIKIAGFGDLPARQSQVYIDLDASYNESKALKIPSKSTTFARAKTSVSFGSTLITSENEKPIENSKKPTQQIGLTPRLITRAFGDLKIQAEKNPFERKPVAPLPKKVSPPASPSKSPPELVYFKAPEYPKHLKPKRTIKLPPAAVTTVSEDLPKGEKIIPRRLSSRADNCCQMKTRQSEETNRFKMMAEEAEIKFDDDSDNF